MNPFDYPPADYNFVLRSGSSKRDYRRFELSFKPAFPTAEIGGDFAGGELYHPEHFSSAPLAVVAHGMGDTSLIPARWLARLLLKRGWAAYLPHLTAHSSRTPKINNPLSLTSDEWFEVYRTSVVEIRQALDWIVHESEIDQSRVIIIGISFGGFVSAITMALDRRIKAGILIESGGNASRINYLSRTMRHRYGRIPSSYEILQREYQAFLAASAGRDLWQMNIPNRHFLTDPLTFAPRLKGRPLMMINGWFDALIPREAASEMARAAEARLHWLPAGHLSLWAYYPVVSCWVKQFLSRNFPG